MEELSPKKYSVISKLSSFFEENNIKFNLNKNIFEINSDIDENILKANIKNILNNLKFKGLEIDEISFFGKLIITIKIQQFDGTEEYVKIIYNKGLKYYKKQLLKMFGMK